MSDQPTDDVAAILNGVTRYGLASYRIGRDRANGKLLQPAAKDLTEFALHAAIRKLADDRDRWRTDAERAITALRLEVESKLECPKPRAGQRDDTSSGLFWCGASRGAAFHAFNTRDNPDGVCGCECHDPYRESWRPKLIAALAAHDEESAR